MHLILIVLILVLDLKKFFVSIFLNLLDGHGISINEFLVVFLLLVDLSLLVLHLFLVLLLFEEDLVFVILLDLFDGSEEVLIFTLFLGLKFGELLSIIKHASRVLVSLLLNLVLLLVKKLATLNFFGVLGLFNLTEETLFLVLSLLAL